MDPSEFLGAFVVLDGWRQILVSKAPSFQAID
jgi:hypothetical protein